MWPLILLCAASWLLVWSCARLIRGPGPVRPAPGRPPTRMPVRRMPVRRTPVRRVRADVPHLLYRYVWAATLRTCYYGISNEPPARHARHLIDPDDQWWMSRSTGVMIPVCWYPNRAAARAAERAAVRAGAAAGEDLANDHHNPVRRPRRAAIR